MSLHSLQNALRGLARVRVRGLWLGLWLGSGSEMCKLHMLTSSSGCVCVQNVQLDDEAVLEHVTVTEPSELTSATLTASQQALLLGLWSVHPPSMFDVSTVICGNTGWSNKKYGRF